MHAFTIKINKKYITQLVIPFIDIAGWIKTYSGVENVKSKIGVENTEIRLQVQEDKLEDFLLELEKKVEPHVKKTKVYNALIFEPESDCGAVLEAFIEKRRQEIKNEAAKEKLLVASENKVVGYSQAMSEYMQELKQVTAAFASIDQKKQLYEKAILVSMDQHWGYVDFLECIRANIEIQYGVSKTMPIKMFEYKHSYNSETLGKQRKAVNDIERMLFDEDSFLICSYNIDDALGNIENAEFLNHMRLLKEGAERVFFVFCIPYMEQEKVKEVEMILSEVISLRTVIVPPIPMEHQIGYMKDKFTNANFTLGENCDELLEQWIEQEEADGYFYGFETLDKMVSELIYHKAKQGEGFTDIQSKDIEYWLNDSKNDNEKDVYELLEELIGLTNVKVRVKEIVAQVKLQKKLVEEGKDVDKPSLHMLFLGNPGTGKTTVARIVGKIFAEENLLSKGLCFDMLGADFLKVYVGSSVQAVRDTCKQVQGSILFIDEAYGMSVGTTKGNTTDEILPTLVAEMENNRDDFCVIFAGYKDEMEAFLEQNSGLKSRIPHIIEFPNYSREELIEIFYHMVDGKFEYEDALKETLESYIMGISDAELDAKEFSNARFVRNLYERLWGKAAYRMNFGEDKSMILKKEDLDKVLEEDSFKEMMGSKGAKRIGFN